MRKSFLYLLALSCILVCYTSLDAYAQKGKSKRPARRAKVQDTRVYLVHADVLHYDQRLNADATILNGKVHFTHQGARLYCDSAYFYEASNSFEAFGHVKLYQGDTVSLFSDYAYYDGNAQLARARYNVVLKHRKTTLYTDSLDFDRIYDNAYFFEGGKMIDGNDIVGGEGPMAPTRCGSIPAAEMIRYAFNHADKKETLGLTTKTGGFVSHLGTSDALDVFNRAEAGDKEAKLIWDTMTYQIIKYIGAMATVLHGKVDGILLGGGMVHNKKLVADITEACSWIAEVIAYPGEFELEAMAAGAIRVLDGVEEAKVYTGEPCWTPKSI